MLDTLNLSDNPFDPDLPIVGRNTGDALRPDLYENSADDDGRALRKELDKLLFMNVGGMGVAESTLLRAIFEGPPPQQRVRRNAVLLIVGPRGSGRSTLANRLATALIQNGVANGDQEQWDRIDLVFDRFLPPPDLNRAFDEKRTEIIGRKGNRFGKLLLMVDNLPRASLDYVLSTFDAFPNLRRVFIVTTSDMSLLQGRDLNESSIHIEPVELTRLTEAEMRAFIEDRVSKYRASIIPTISNQPEFVLFPFAESFAKTMAESPKPLQSFRTTAYKRIDDRHHEVSLRPGLVDAVAADAADLRTRMIER